MTKKQLTREIMQNICFPVSETLEPNKEYIYVYNYECTRVEYLC